MWTFIAVLLLLIAGLRAQTYDNNPQGILYKNCADTEAVSRVKSFYSNGDRQWKIDCMPFFDTANDCSWSEFITLSDQELSFNCKADHVITGLYSVYNSGTSERTWSFRCCSAPKLVTFECGQTPKFNYLKEEFDWYVPGNNFLTGVHTHNQNSGDHRWSFSFCRGVQLDSQVVSSQILTANSPLGSLFTEGDVVEPTTRNAITCTNCKWPMANGQVQVPYMVSDSFSNGEKHTIQTAIDKFHLSTCVRFIPRSSQEDYVSIVKRTGCWSYVGKIGYKQEVSLGDGCLFNGIIQHELIHALGFWHEQSRTDRDVYVKINLENIPGELQGNFQKHETNNLNVPYDYSSVMHYGQKAFSGNGRDTITPLQSTASIGQRRGMTENDLLKINKLYKCENYLNKNGDWDSVLSQNFNRSCPEGQAVSSITSSFDSETKDRLWAVTCKAFEKTQQCRWSSTVNQYEGALSFSCAENEVIAGVSGEYEGSKQDRKWKFYCCKASFTISNCRDDPVSNYWQEYFSWKVADSNYLTGVKSTFDGGKLDRRWRFSYCQKSLQ